MTNWHQTSAHRSKAPHLGTYSRLSQEAEDATLFVKHVEVSPTTSLAIENTLLRKTAQYHLHLVVVKSVTVPKRSNLNTNPFQLIHRNLDRFVLYVIEIQKHLPILINFDNVGTSTLAYDPLFSGLGIHHQNNGHLIMRDMFNKGYFVLAFDLTSDSAGQDSHTSLQTEGSVRFELQFKTDLDTTITCLFYSEYEGTDADWIMRRFTDLFSTTDLCKNDRLAITLVKRRLGRCPRCTNSGAQTCVPSSDIKSIVISLDADCNEEADVQL
uniref:Uncharacterized protein n=1 Tax=Timema shepardi TaxID=629360 RepID=A0A7R9FZB8_TIMSH|nr:unnamed protein product [Timema shepardi]